MYQCLVLLSESRATTPMTGPLAFGTKEAREAYVNGPAVYWYHMVEDDDWFSWKRGGAWKATEQPGPADTVPEPPEITEEDRW